MPDDRDGPEVHAAATSDERPNVLIYMVDTLRADALGCYGYDKPTSPEIDAFAADNQGARIAVIPEGPYTMLRA